MREKERTKNRCSALAACNVSMNKPRFWSCVVTNHFSSLCFQVRPKQQQHHCRLSVMMDMSLLDDVGTLNMAGKKALNFQLFFHVNSSEKLRAMMD